LNADEVFVVNVSNQSPDGSFFSDLRLFDSVGTDLGLTYNYVYQHPAWSAIVTIAGTYYLGVSSAYGYDPLTSGSASGGTTTGSYTLDLSQLPLHNTPATAIPLALDINQKAEVSGAIQDPHQENLYAVQLNAGSLLVADAHVQGLWATLRVLDDTGTQLRNDAGSGAETELGFVVPATATYYVGVSG